MQETEPTPPASGVATRSRDALRRPRVAIPVVVGVAAVAAAVAWAVGGFGSASDTAPPGGPTQGAVGLSEGGLATIAQAVGQPIFWAGPRRGYLYEMRHTSGNDVYIRYLPPGVKVGSKRDDLLIVATYPYANALQALQKSSNGQALSIPNGGIAVVDGKDARSVHLAFPGVGYQVEVYDSSPARSLQLARSGEVRPVS